MGTNESQDSGISPEMLEHVRQRQAYQSESSAGTEVKDMSPDAKAYLKKEVDAFEKLAN